jgi:hypothetical protein
MTEEEQAEYDAAVQLQKRNPGTPVEYFRRRDAERAQAELAARQAALRGDPRAIRVEDPYDRATIGSRARMGQHSRAINAPRGQQLRMMRSGPPRSGPHPWDDDAECIDAPEGFRRGSRF